MNINKKRGINCQLIFNQPPKSLWKVISAPNHLELFHPFCKENIAISWDGMPYIDELEYLNGLKYVEFAKKYKFEYFVHGDDWKKNIQSKVRSDLIKTMKKWNGKVLEFAYTKNISSSKIKMLVKKI